VRCKHVGSKCFVLSSTTWIQLATPSSDQVRCTSSSSCSSNSSSTGNYFRETVQQYSTNQTREFCMC
jgi:hypothetical protein